MLRNWIEKSFEYFIEKITQIFDLTSEVMYCGFKQHLSWNTLDFLKWIPRSVLNTFWTWKNSCRNIYKTLRWKKGYLSDSLEERKRRVDVPRGIPEPLLVFCLFLKKSLNEILSVSLKKFWWSGTNSYICRDCWWWSWKNPRRNYWKIFFWKKSKRYHWKNFWKTHRCI